MNRQSFKISVVFLLAFLTGVNFVVFPALAPVFTSPDFFGLSVMQFGNLFIPQVVCIALSCLLTPFLVNKFGPKKILSAGILLMLISTALLWISQFFINEKSLLFYILLLLVAITGSGFGLSITTLNPLAASLFQDKKAAAILVLQFLVGLGTSSSPLMMGLIPKMRFWTMIPAAIFILVLIAFIFLCFVKFETGDVFHLPAHFKIPAKLWVFFAAIMLYGLLEGTFGGFGSVILKDLGLNSHLASIGLSIFWGGVAVNRLLFGILSNHLNLSKVFLVSPLFIGFLIWVLVSASSPPLVLGLMFSIGFFMGSLFPGTIGWATVEFPQLAVLVSGMMMAADQIGTGIVTNTLGTFKEDGILDGLKYLSIITAVIFIVMIYLRKNSKMDEAF